MNSIWARTLSAAILLLTILLASTSASAEAQTLSCRKGVDLRCWYLVGGLGEAPNRVGYIARHANPEIVDGKREVELIQIVEATTHPDWFTLWRMEVDCVRARFRVNVQYSGRRGDGLIRGEPPDAPDWQTFEEARFGEMVVQDFACVPGYEDQQDMVMFLGDAYRAPDMLHQFRSIFWSDD